MLIVSNKHLLDNRVKGIYLMYDKKDNLLYIGKTNHLHKRLVQHLYTANTMKDDWRSRIKYIKYYVVNLDIDRELYETYLINKLKPKHNLDKIYKAKTTLVLPELTLGDTLFIEDVPEVHDFKTTLKMYCEAYDKDDTKVMEDCLKIKPDIKDYVDILGTKRVRSLRYVRKNLKQDVIFYSEEIQNKIKEHLQKVIKVGDFFTKKEIKFNVLKPLYESLNLTQAPKACDIKKYYNITATQRTLIEKGKRVHGFIIKSPKF